MKKKFAFTLAELLITVTIIGVVAAITMPTFLQDYQKHILVNQLRKSHSLISQAFQRMMFDGRAVNFSETQYGRNRGHNNSAEYLAKYLKVIDTEYTADENNIYITLDNSPLSETLRNKIYLADGSIIFDDGSYFYIDVNGEEGPNIMDRDLFKFTISTTGRLVPYSQSGSVVGYERDEYGVEDTNRPIFGSDSDCTANGCGAARIINAGWKMDY